MSVDRGPFGTLLRELTELGYSHVDFKCSLNRSDDDVERWASWAMGVGKIAARGGGRTGEEALRACVDDAKR